MEAILRELLENVGSILTGLPLEWDSIPEEHKKAVVTIALHCVLNGPVGVQKSTTFPLIGGPQKISTLVKTTNSGWKGFCRTIALKVKEFNPKIDCSTRRRSGDYWPLAG
jgi:hypothetical protein